MQTPKSLSRNGSSEVPKRTSPVNPRSSRQSSVTGSESDSATPCPGVKTPTNRSPRVADRRSPRSPVPEKKRVSKVNELGSQITQLQEDLKKTKDQLASSETSKKQAEQDAEEANMQFTAVTAKLEDVQRQLQELSESEDARVQELRKIGQERDQAWQSELEAVQKQHSVDSSALLSAMNEIQRLKVQLEMAMNSEAAQSKQTELANTELLALEQDTAETLSLVESLKTQIKESEKSEEDRQKLVNDTQQQLEKANATIDALQSDGLKALESYNSILIELAESKAHINSLEEIVKNIKEDNQVKNGDSTSPDAESLRAELNSLNSEAEQLKSALEVAEIRYQEEHIKCTMQVQTTYEAAENMKTESNLRELKLELVLKETKDEAAELKARLVEKETELKCKNDLNEKLNAELGKLQNDKTEVELETQLSKVTADVAELKAKLIDKETELQNVLEESDRLKLEMEKIEADRIKNIEATKTEVEIARSAEQEALERVGIVTEESVKTCRRAARMSEQLEAAQAVNSDMETELKRLRIQTEQWRKAAEAAAAILTTGNNSRLVERSGSLDADYNSIAGKLLNSPFSDDLDESSPKKKNNMLRKIGGFLKKGQK